jgi:Porin PorA
MNRRVGYALAFVGFFLVFFALCVRFYAYPRLQKVPLNHYSQSVATGTGTYFNRAQLREITGAQLQNIRTAKGDPRAGSPTTAVWDTFSALKDLADGGVITAAQERIAMDRVTGQSRRCCGEKPAHSGLTLKFPFDTKKQTYQFWDSAAGRAPPAVYTREETIQGVKVYRFEQRIDRLTLGTQEIPGSLAGGPSAASVQTNIVYSNVRAIWVEPRTGIIVKGQQDVNETLQTNDGRRVLTVVRARLLLDDNTVRRNVEDAAAAAGRLRMLSTILPIGALVLGLALLVVGVILSGRQVSGRARREEEVPEPRPA